MTILETLMTIPIMFTFQRFFAGFAVWLFNFRQTQEKDFGQSGQSGGYFEGTAG